MISEDSDPTAVITDTMPTNCHVIQLLEPDPPSNSTIDEDDDSLAVEEGGVLALEIGVTSYAVVFDQAKLNAGYDFLEDDITNEVDGEDTLEIGCMMTDRTVDGFTLTLDADPDTVNYRFNWRCRVTEV